MLKKIVKNKVLRQLRQFFLVLRTRKIYVFIYIKDEKKLSFLTQAIFCEFLEERREQDGFCKSHMERSEKER